MRSGSAFAAAVVAAGGLAVAAAPTGAAAAGSPLATVVFTATGEHAFTVPPAVFSIHVVAIGGKGGGGYAAPGGEGARAEADLRVAPGSILYAEVGGDGAPATPVGDQWAAGGANGGGIGGAWDSTEPDTLGFPPLSGGGGGGASDVQTCPVSACRPVNLAGTAALLLAAGGGGAGADSAGGAGGTPVGGDAALTANQLGRGLGATDTHPGGNSYTGIDDVIDSMRGGEGFTFGGGGGGAGFYGGGGGVGGWQVPYQLSGGGGGGASHGPAGTAYSNTVEAPSVTISYPSPATVRLAPASRSSLALDVSGGGVVQAAQSGGDGQRWTLVPQNSLYQLVNKATGTCLSTDGVPGDQLILGPCQALAQNLWQLPANFGAPANGSLIWNPAFDLYIDVYGGSTSAGAPIDAWPYNGGYANQYFLPSAG